MHKLSRYYPEYASTWGLLGTLHEEKKKGFLDNEARTKSPTAVRVLLWEHSPMLHVSDEVAFELNAFIWTHSWIINNMVFGKYCERILFATGNR